MYTLSHFFVLIAGLLSRSLENAKFHPIARSISFAPTAQLDGTPLASAGRFLVHVFPAKTLKTRFGNLLRPHS